MKSQKNLFKLIFLLSLFLILPNWAISQDKKEKEDKEKKDAYQFTISKEVARTSVKNQSRTSTCWCFATISFLESELLRSGKNELDLSEMYIVRHTYPIKAQRYVRLHGGTNFPHGGASHDVIDMMKLHGLVPDEVYKGLNYGEEKHKHGEMGSILKGMVDAVVKKRGGRVTPRWLEAFESVLDVYLGEPLESFNFKGKKYSPENFVNDYMGLNLDDYIEISSYSHHPFYEQFCLELPDNWTNNDKYYNVPIEDLGRIVDHAINNGYSVVYGGDTSNKYFSSKKGYGIVPLKDWEDLTEKERKKDIEEPVEEKEPTQELRQNWFDNYTATDDHSMHIVGIAKDQNGNPFYLTKNSWGTDRKYDGYVYLSKSYILLNATGFMVNKNSLPNDIKQKLGL